MVESVSVRPLLILLIIQISARFGLEEVRLPRYSMPLLPMLKCVILTNNRLGKLADVDPLATFKRLTHLSLMNNPVTRAENYRAYVIYKLKKLKVLDFRKVKPKEREAAEELFGGDEGEAAMEAAKTPPKKQSARPKSMERRFLGATS